MKITVERAPLLAALRRAKRTVERRSIIPILSHLLLRLMDGGLQITATDLDMEIVETIKAEGEAGEAITLPAHTLADIVAKLPDGAQVQIELKGDRGDATIRAGRSRFTLGTLPAMEFPDLAKVDTAASFSVKGAELAEAIDRVEFAISTEETRCYLNGIYLHPAPRERGEPAKLRLVATDGHRLSLAEVALPGPAGLRGRHRAAQGRSRAEAPRRGRRQGRGVHRSLAGEARRQPQ